MLILMDFNYPALLVLGLCLGSFAGASVWRLRSRQLREDKVDGEKVDKREYKKLLPLAAASVLGDYSRCLECGYRLKWYDMIPVVSWLTLGGRCRKCKKPIGYMEPLIELGLGIFFVASYAFWPQPLNNNIELIRFIIWLIAGVALAILFVYDAMWSLLPDAVNFFIIGLGLINSALVIASSTDKPYQLLSIIGGAFIMSGLYLVIYLISRGRWIGFGDVKLGLGLSLLQANWAHSFLALFAANLIGCMIVIPGMLLGKLKRDSHVPFGPLLILGFITAFFFGKYILDTFFFSLS